MPAAWGRAATSPSPVTPNAPDGASGSETAPMNADVIEIAARDVRRQGRPLAEQLADGKVAVLRDVPALKLFRAELIRAASDAAQSIAAAAELTEFYEHGRAPGIASLHGLVAAIKSTRDERYLSECLAPL